MLIKYPKGIEIELSKDEAVEIFYAVKERLITAIKKHWINYPENFQKSELISLNILKELSKITSWSYEKEILPELLSCLNKGE